MGIIAGFGRGMPGRPGAPPSREAGGRGGRWSPDGAPVPPPVLGAGPRSAGAGRRPMPWLDENGLLPGRGVPLGLPTGRGAGAFGAGAFGVAEAAAAGASAAGVSGAAGASEATGSAATGSAATGSAGTSAAGLGAGFGPGRGPGFVAGLLAAAGASTGAGFSAAGAAGASGAAAGASAGAGLAASLVSALAGAAGAEVAAAALSCSPYSFLNRFATGGSMVEDADLTNSPISFSFSRTNLLSTPNSLASSCTRGLATLLLLARAPTLPDAGGGDSDR